MYILVSKHLVSDALVLRSHVEHLAHVNHGASSHEFLTGDASLGMILHCTHAECWLFGEGDEARLCAGHAQLVLCLACIIVCVCVCVCVCGDTEL